MSSTIFKQCVRKRNVEGTCVETELCKQYTSCETCSLSDDGWCEPEIIRDEPQSTVDRSTMPVGGDIEQNSFPFNKRLVRELMAEFIGTFLIVQLGTGSVMSAIYTDSLVGLFQVASVWIIAVTVAICTTASISGAHLNPAVSLAFALVRPSDEFNWRKVLPYSLAQLAGAVGGSAVNLILYAGSIEVFESTNSIVRGSSSGIASARAFGEYYA